MSESGWQSYLVCCTMVIVNDVAQGLTQKQIALTYAMAIISERNKADLPDWAKINQAILDRWGQKGLNRVKNLAWALIEEKTANLAKTLQSDRN